MKLDALSAEEWNYLRGLFLSDGYSCAVRCKGKTQGYHVRFYLCGGEEEKALVARVVELLRRVGLNPYELRDLRKNMVTVRVCSKSLMLFLPDKRSLREDAVTRDKFFQENNLFTVQGGVPFIGGLLDGDGCCQVQVVRSKRSCFGNVSQWLWRFSQRKYLFLVDYVQKFVESLAQNSVNIYTNPNSVTNLRIRKSGIIALLDAKVDSYSLRVVGWLDKVAKVRDKIERSKYYNMSQVARVLGVTYSTVLRLLKSGQMKCMRRTIMSKRLKPSLSYHYLPADKIGEVRKLLSEEERVMQEIRSRGMKLVDVAKMLSISRDALYDLYRDGKLRATMVHDNQSQARRYLLIPNDEIKYLKKKYIIEEA